MFKKALFPTILVATGCAVACSVARANPTALTFEGLAGSGTSSFVADYYSGGRNAYSGTYGPDYGITFTANAVAGLVNPPGLTLLTFSVPPRAIMDVADGFTTSLSFYYWSSVAGPVSIWDAPGGQGNLLGVIDVVPQAPGTTACFGPFYVYLCNGSLLSTAFEGVARSVDFGPVGGWLRIDYITLGSLLPAGQARGTIGTSGGDLAPAVFSTNSNAYAAASLNFNGGTLRYSADTVTNKNATLGSGGGTFDTNGFAVTLSGVIAGPGGLGKVGGGTLSLPAVNTYSGITTIAGGTLALTGNGSIAGSRVMIIDGAFDISATNSGASIPGLAGAGRVNLGARTLVLTDAANTFAGVIGGAGGLTLAAGTQTLSGNNTYTGTTQVQAGTLRVDGSLASPVQVDAGATLGGSGRITGPVRVSGRLAPGGSPGTLSVVGPVTLNPGSRYQEEIDGPGIGNGAGNYDRLLVTGPFVANGTLDIVLRGIAGPATNSYTPALGERLRIVTARGGIQGRFAAVNSAPVGLAAGTRFDTFYNGDGSNSIDLFVTPASYAAHVAALGANGNAQAAGESLDWLRAQDGANRAEARQNRLRYDLAGLDSARIAGVTTLLAGELHGAMAAAAPQGARWLQTLLAAELSDTGGGPGAGRGHTDTLWLDLHAAEGRADGGARASGYSASRTQFTLGGDLRQGSSYRMGLGLTYSSTRVDPDSGSGTLEETAPFLYAQYRLDTSTKILIDSIFSYGFSTWETHRPDPLRQSGALKTDTSGQGAALGLNVRAPLALGAVRVEPFVRLLWQDLRRGNVVETGGSPAALWLEDYDQSGTRVLLGAAVGSAASDPLAGAFTYRASLAMGQDFGDLLDPSVQASLAGAQLRIDTPRVGRTFAQVELNATYRLMRNAYLTVGLNGEAHDGYLGGGVDAGFNYQF